MTFSKYWRGYKHLCPLRLIIWRGRSPAPLTQYHSMFIELAKKLLAQDTIEKHDTQYSYANKTV